MRSEFQQTGGFAWKFTGFWGIRSAYIGARTARAGNAPVRSRASSIAPAPIEVRGKRGVGYCKSMAGTVRPFERMLARNNPEPTDRLFPNDFKKMLNGILTEQKLKFDRNGKARTAYSLRHSYICFRLLEGADIYQVAKNCRTSVEMIEKHYAAHLKDMIDTSLVNVRKLKSASLHI